jgi:hypothetical protein
MEATMMSFLVFSSMVISLNKVAFFLSIESLPMRGEFPATESGRLVRGYLPAFLELSKTEIEAYA